MTVFVLLYYNPCSMVMYSWKLAYQLFWYIIEQDVAIVELRTRKCMSQSIWRFLGDVVSQGLYLVQVIVSSFADFTDDMCTHGQWFILNSWITPRFSKCFTGTMSTPPTEGMLILLKWYFVSLINTSVKVSLIFSDHPGPNSLYKLQWSSRS